MWSLWVWQDVNILHFKASSWLQYGAFDENVKTYMWGEEKPTRRRRYWIIYICRSPCGVGTGELEPPVAEPGATEGLLWLDTGLCIICLFYSLPPSYIPFEICLVLPLVQICSIAYEVLLRYLLLGFELTSAKKLKKLSHITILDSIHHLNLGKCPRIAQQTIRLRKIRVHSGERSWTPIELAG